MVEAGLGCTVSFRPDRATANSIKTINGSEQDIGGEDVGTGLPPPQFPNSTSWSGTLNKHCYRSDKTQWRQSCPMLQTHP